MIAIPIEVLLWMTGIVAAAICASAVSQNIQQIVPGRWDLYERGELVLSDAEYGEALDLAESDAKGLCIGGDDEWWLAPHGEPMSDGVGIVSDNHEYRGAVKEVKKVAGKLYGRGEITQNDYNRIIDNFR